MLEIYNVFTYNHRRMQILHFVSLINLNGGYYVLPLPCQAKLTCGLPGVQALDPCHSDKSANTLTSEVSRPSF